MPGIEPPPGVVRAADTLDQCILHFLRNSTIDLDHDVCENFGEDPVPWSTSTGVVSSDAPIPEMVLWLGSTTEINTLTRLMTEHLLSITTLARADLAALPSAAVLARSAFEASVRAQWLMSPNDVMDREGRWVTCVRAASDTLLRSARELPAGEDNRRRLEESAAALSQVADECAAHLPRRVTIPGQLPNFRHMLASLQIEHHYVHYIQMSQFTHASYGATSIYRKGIANALESGQFITAEHWKPVFDVAWLALESLGNRAFPPGREGRRPFGVNLPAMMSAAIDMMDVDE